MLFTVPSEFRALSALVRNGRQQEDAIVNMKVMEGPGIYFSAIINGLSCGIWLSEIQWASWLESTVGADSGDDLHPDLFIGISHWALSCLPTLFPELTVSHDLPRPMHLTKQWALVCTNKIEHHVFHFILLNWPAPFLLKTLQDWDCVDEDEDANFYQEDKDNKLQYECGLVAGVCRLSLSDLQKIQVEDGLRLVASAELNQGHCWMWPEKGSQFYINLKEGGMVTIKDINNDIDAFLELYGETDEVFYEEPDHNACEESSSESDRISQSEEAPKQISLNELTQTLVMEIGRISMPIESLNQLSVGETLNCQTSSYGEVMIRLNARKVGSGHLLNCDGELIVRIDQWLLSHEKIS